jgi:signal transduction histidine kinase
MGGPENRRPMAKNRPVPFMARSIMSRFRDIPIRRKLMLITMMTNCLALLLLGSAFVIYERLTYQKKVGEELEFTALIAAGIVLVVSMISWVVSSRLQRVISDPIASLAGVVAHVADTKDYSLRAVKQSEDELGKLIDGFNEMIFQIQQRDAALETAGKELENRIEERTSELADSVSMIHATLESTADGILAVSFSGEKVSYNSQFAKMWRIPTAVQERGDHAEFLAVACSQLKDPEGFNRKLEELFRSEDVEASEMLEFLDGRIFERHSMPQRVDGRNVGMVFNFRDVTGRQTTEAILRDSENFLRSTLNALSAHIAILDERGVIVKTNAAWNRFARDNDYNGDRYGLGDCYLAVCDSAVGDFAEEGSEVAAGIREVMAGLTDEFILEYPCHSPTEERWFVVRATRFEGENPMRVVVSHENITARVRAEAELEKSLGAQVENSRLAGMAEVATSVLHNIGNVLNSVNVSCSVVSDLVRKSRISSVTKTAALLRQNEADLAGFFTTHPNGRKLPDYLEKLAQRLSAEQSTILDEVHLMDKNIEHIKDIVSVQQNYAKNPGGGRETMALETLVEDALRLNSAALIRHQIEVVREYTELSAMPLEKHKILQILVNLVRNAKQAISAGDGAEKRLTVRITGHDGYDAVSVCDNGIGIAPENLTRIFAHGFTTKKDGHGFGLHSGALAAQEMGGRLTVHSAGPNTGATFTLEIPHIPATTS